MVDLVGLRAKLGGQIADGNFVFEVPLDYVGLLLSGEISTGVGLGRCPTSELCEFKLQKIPFPSRQYTKPDQVMNIKSKETGDQHQIWLYTLPLINIVKAGQ